MADLDDITVRPQHRQCRRLSSIEQLPPKLRDAKVEIPRESVTVAVHVQGLATAEGEPEVRYSLERETSHELLERRERHEFRRSVMGAELPRNRALGGGG